MMTLGSVGESRGPNPGNVRVRLPLVLATMHFSWGWGFLTSPPRAVGVHERRRPV